MTLSTSTPAAALWNKARPLIKQEINAPAFAQWFEGIRPLALSENGIELGVSDDFFADWIETNYGDVISNALIAVSQNPNFKHALLPGYEMEEAPSPSLSRNDVHGLCQVPIYAAPNFESLCDNEEEPLMTLPEGCDPTYTFDNFVVGEENRIAYYAALKAAQNPGLYNPLFVYGNTALGKTHLMQAIATEYCKTHKRPVVKYITCEQMMNDYTQLIYFEKKPVEFRNRYRDVDILLVDDVQFLGNKENLQEEFFNTFNTLHHDRRQIVLTSDKRPSDINGLEERLVSRFESGLTAEIIPPSYETRLAVVKKYREMYGSRVSDEVAEFLARRITANMRRLKGAMMQVSAFEAMHRETELTLQVAENMLAGMLVSERSSKRVAVEEVQRKVAEHFDIRLPDLLGSRRTKNLAGPRQIAMYLSRKLTGLSYPDIAAAFDGKNHATIIHAFNKVESEMETDQDLRIAVTVLERLLKD